MVCISCIVIPVFIWLWYRFIQPLLVKLNILSQSKPAVDSSKTDAKTELKCPFSGAKSETSTEAKKDQ